MRRWWRAIRQFRYLGEAIAVTIAVALLVAAIVISATSDANRAKACHDAGGTLVGQVCYAPGVVIEPGR